MGLARTPLFLFSFLTVLALTPVYSSWADADISVSATELNQEIASHLTDTPEFAFIRNEATRLGISHAYLFGGTAAALGHYAKWDVQRKKGDTRFQPDRFDYDYTNIYRSTQDADIVIDGTPEQAQALQKALAEKFPHLQGSKSVWEVRLLKAQIGDKEALLDNPDYLNQHTDSNSTGMIELTQSQDPLIRDLRDWNSKEPIFLKDIESGTLHYYYSPLHETTSRFKDGRNPPIVSAIRYLTKAFQYELKIPREDERILKKIISQFDPKMVQGSYLPGWIEKNGKKLIQNAVNIEYAWNELERLGLRKKLIEIRDNPTVSDSLSFWLSKEPLRSAPLGKGNGKTAGQLGIDVVAHETNSFLAYESITRAHTGDANVLISREYATDETAVHGDGFYTAMGKTGARGTGLTIRFKVKPQARLGTDFILARDSSLAEGSYVIFRNRRALQVIPESLNIGPVEYFEMLASNQSLGKDDLGILEKLKRRLATRARVLDDLQKQQLSALLKIELEKPALPFSFLIEFQKDFPQLFKLIPEDTRKNLLSILETKLKARPLPLTFLKNFELLFPEIYRQVKPGTIEAINDELINHVRSAQYVRDVDEQIEFAQLKPAEMTRALADLVLRAGGHESGVFPKYLKYLTALNPSARKTALRTALEIQEAYPDRPLNIQSLAAKVAPELFYNLIDRNPKYWVNVVSEISSNHQDSDPRFRAQVASLLDSPDPEMKFWAIHAFIKFTSITDAEKSKIFQEISSPNRFLRNAAVDCIHYKDLIPPPEAQIPILKEFLSHRHETTKFVSQILRRMTWEPETFAAALNEFEKTGNHQLYTHIVYQAKKRPEYLESMVALAEKSPFSYQSMDLITSLNCQTEACIKIYLGILQNPAQFEVRHQDALTREAIVELMSVLNPPLDSKILNELKNWIFERKVEGMNPQIRAKIGVLYARGGGEDPKTLKKVIELIKRVSQWRFDPSHLKVLKDLDVKLKANKHCAFKMLEQLIH